MSAIHDIPKTGKPSLVLQLRACGPWITLGLVAGMGALLVACGTVNRPLVVPPHIPGAEFVGTEACAECHEELTKGFVSASHARLQVPGANGKEAGCESCHGPGSRHSESGGEPGTIINPKKSGDVCFQCHLDVRGAFHLPHRHPVLEGRLTCSECHDHHQGPAVRGGGTSMMSEQAACVECHQAQRGPFVFEHEALREGCTVCHQAHGSVNPKLLTQRNATLCLKCHFQRQTGSGQIMIGNVNHARFLREGTCWSAGCHEAVHGSQVTPTLRY